MVTKRLKLILLIYLVLFGLVGTRNLITGFPFSDHPLYHAINFILSGLITVGVLCHWATSMSKRIMHKEIKRYMITIVVLQVVWLTLRNIKWMAFEYGNDPGRWLWYLFYVPMFLIPLLLLFTALSVSKDESYRRNKKWNLLLIPTIVLLLLILTNDHHQLVFGFHPNFQNWDREYSYHCIYPSVMLFIVFTIMAAIITLFRKWRKMDKSKGIGLILLVSTAAVAYLVTYLVNRSLVSIALDITSFYCIICLAFLESCIQTGLIRSNNRHKEIFEKANITAQILDQDGKTQYRCIGATDISQTDFILLKENNKLQKDENTLSHIAPIHGGYVTWNSDITEINQTIQEIERANQSLYDEVELLKRAHEQQQERVRTEKRSAIQDLIFAEIKPITAQIKCRILQSEQADPAVKKQCLYEISILSAYIKRKTNLILMAQIRTSISTEELAPCFQESFQNLGFCNSSCYLNIVQHHDINIDIAMLTYDLFEQVLEKVAYCPKEVLITYDIHEGKTRFTIRVCANQCEQMMDLVGFQKEKLAQKGLCITVEQETDGYYIALHEQ